MAHGAMPWLLVTVGAAVIMADLLLATSLGLRATLVRFHLQRTFPRISLGFLTVLVCALGVALVAGGLSALSHS
jgi:hypothetical protein